MDRPAVHAEEQQEIHRFLSAGEWYGGLPAPLQALILSRSVVRKYAKGQVISLEASVPKGLYAVLEGMVHAVREVGSGDEALIHVCEPGYWFAEYAVLTGKPTVATFVAHAPVRALLLSKVQLDRIVAEEPRYYEAFARLALDRYAILVRLFAEVRDLAPEARLRGRLAVMAQMRMQERSHSGAVSLAVSQADLARIVGVSRQTLNALLGKLSQAGLIEVGFRSIRVLDAGRLAHATDAEAPAPATRKGRARVLREPSRATSERID
jgi:CRP/FNR family transcriptional regulator, cyclic AMP receptor protein